MKKLSQAPPAGAGAMSKLSEAGDMNAVSSSVDKAQMRRA